MRIEETHIHTPPPSLGDTWAHDDILRSILARTFDTLSPLTPPSGAQPSELLSRLAAFSTRINAELVPLGKLLDIEGSEPQLVQYDLWGRRVDELHVSEGWRRIGDWFSSVGILGEAYGPEGQEEELKHPSSAGGRDRLGASARLYAQARAYLASVDTHVALCPISMTDGAIFVMLKHATPSQRKRYLPRLLARDPAQAFKAGQWMTERIGGSDVAYTETKATRIGEGEGKPGDLYLLDGFKWFSSAADGHLSLALARTHPDASLGSRGLSLFAVPLRRVDRPPLPPGFTVPSDARAPHSKLNGIRIHRLKHKLGTRHVPTAELELDGAVGELIGQPGRGVAIISAVLNITRLYSGSGSVASIARSHAIAASYALQRSTRGTLLADLPLHTRSLARVNVTYAALAALLWHTAALQSKAEAGLASEREQRRLRILTPTLKTIASNKGTEALALSLEALGGQGYMHENQQTTILRDATVERVWEGTGSVLSLDVARVHLQTQGLALREWAEDTLAGARQASASLGNDAHAAATVQTIEGALGMLSAKLSQREVLKGTDQRLARALLDLVGLLTAAEQLLTHAAYVKARGEGDEAGLYVERARRWLVEGGLNEALLELEQGETGIERRLALALAVPGKGESKL